MSEQAVFDALKYRVDVDMFGTRRYYNSDNQLHRMGGPAVEYVNGHVEWWQNGQHHRIDGPAIEWCGGTKIWYQYDIRHRTDGPAVEWASGFKEWYINGEELTEDEYNQRVKNV